MRNLAAISLGLLFILMALILAARPADQAASSPPNAALNLATALHASPTVPPTPALPPTLAPTVTVIPGWNKFTTASLPGALPATELWLPAGFVGGDMLAERENTLVRLGNVGKVIPSVSVIARDSGAGLVDAGPASATTVFFAADSIDDYGSAARVRVVNLSPFAADREIYVLDDYLSAWTLFQAPGATKVIEQQPVPGTRYPVFKTSITGVNLPFAYHGLAVSGGLIDEYEYRVEAPNTTWVLIYTCPAGDCENKSPAFARSAESFSVIGSP